MPTTGLYSREGPLPLIHEPPDSERLDDRIDGVGEGDSVVRTPGEQEGGRLVGIRRHDVDPESPPRLNTHPPTDPNLIAELGNSAGIANGDVDAEVGNESG